MTRLLIRVSHHLTRQAVLETRSSAPAPFFQEGACLCTASLQDPTHDRVFMRRVACWRCMHVAIRYEEVGDRAGAVIGLGLGTDRL